MVSTHAKHHAFTTFHPLVNAVYFMVMIGFSMFLLHPLAIGISFACAAAYALCINGRKALRFGLLFMLPMLLFTAAMNPLFNHQGMTILAYLSNGNPVTQEAILFGVAAAGMMVTVITWFACVNAVMTAEKMIYLFGRVVPALSLMLSMALRFIPRFIARAQAISHAQKALGCNAGPFKILSMLVTWALENAIETADSMKARGYGLPGRTAFSLFTFRERDALALAYIGGCLVNMVVLIAIGAYGFRFFPRIHITWTGLDTVTFFIAYTALGALPLILQLKEALYWKRIAPTV